MAFSGGEEINGLGASRIVDWFEAQKITPAFVLDEGGAVVENVFPGVAAPCGLIGIGEKGMLNVRYQVKSSGEDSLNMAICAMAEACYAASTRRSGVSAASVGEVSVHYDSSENADKALRRQLYEKASIYLEIFRGVEG